jgi:hypothetical protein
VFVILLDLSQKSEKRELGPTERCHLLVMLGAGLVIFQSFPISMIAQQTKVVSLASRYGIRKRWSADAQSLVLDVWKEFELRQLRYECGLDRFANIGAELEEN